MEAAPASSYDSTQDAEAGRRRHCAHACPCRGRRSGTCRFEPDCPGYGRDDAAAAGSRERRPAATTPGGSAAVQPSPNYRSEAGTQRSANRSLQARAWRACRHGVALAGWPLRHLLESTLARSACVRFRPCGRALAAVLVRCRPLARSCPHREGGRRARPLQLGPAMAGVRVDPFLFPRCLGTRRTRWILGRVSRSRHAPDPNQRHGGHRRSPVSCERRLSRRAWPRRRAAAGRRRGRGVATRPRGRASR
jgi:hypothetical protein